MSAYHDGGKNARRNAKDANQLLIVPAAARYWHLSLSTKERSSPLIGRGLVQQGKNGVHLKKALVILFMLIYYNPPVLIYWRLVNSAAILDYGCR